MSRRRSLLEIIKGEPNSSNPPPKQIEEKDIPQLCVEQIFEDAQFYETQYKILVLDDNRTRYSASPNTHYRSLLLQEKYKSHIASVEFPQGDTTVFNSGRISAQQALNNIIIRSQKRKNKQTQEAEKALIEFIVAQASASEACIFLFYSPDILSMLKTISLEYTPKTYLDLLKARLSEDRGFVFYCCSKDMVTERSSPEFKARRQSAIETKEKAKQEAIAAQKKREEAEKQAEPTSQEHEAEHRPLEREASLLSAPESHLASPSITQTTFKADQHTTENFTQLSAEDGHSGLQVTSRIPQDEKNHFQYFQSPPNKSKTADAWVRTILQAVIATRKKNQVAVFRQFPPEYADYYVHLQNKIAETIPDEQDRPYIAIQMIGGDRRKDIAVYDVGLAGGTGPLSDAKIISELVLDAADADSFGDRKNIAKKCRDFSAILYSMPPPRDLSHAAADVINFRRHYSALRSQFPCFSLHLLSNTAHLNIGVFRNDLALGGAGEKVDDMTKYVVDVVANDAIAIHTQSTLSDYQSRGRFVEAEVDARRILVLGTKMAHEKKLYPSLFTEKGVTSVLPQTSRSEQNAAETLQKIIDRVKEGQFESVAKEFIDFVLLQVERTKTNTLLFSCTEIPLLLSAKNKEGITYLELLKAALKKKFHTQEFYYYDTEKMFIDRINANRKKMHLICKNPTVDTISSESLFNNLLPAEKEALEKFLSRFTSSSAYTRNLTDYQPKRIVVTKLSEDDKEYIRHFFEESAKLGHVSQNNPGNYKLSQSALDLLIDCGVKKYAGMDLSNLSFENKTLLGCNFNHANLEHCNLSRAAFKGCYFNETNLSNTNAIGTSFHYSTMISTDVHNMCVNIHTDLRDTDQHETFTDKTQIRFMRPTKKTGRSLPVEYKPIYTTINKMHTYYLETEGRRDTWIKVSDGWSNLKEKLKSFWGSKEKWMRFTTGCRNLTTSLIASLPWTSKKTTAEKLFEKMHLDSQRSHRTHRLHEEYVFLQITGSYDDPLLPPKEDRKSEAKPASFPYTFAASSGLQHKPRRAGPTRQFITGSPSSLFPKKGSTPTEQSLRSGAQKIPNTPTLSS